MPTGTSMSERLKTPETAGSFVDGAQLCHPNTAGAEGIRAESSREGVSFFRDRDDEPGGQVRESVYAWPGRPPHQRILVRYAPTKRVEQGETKSFCHHATYQSSSGCLERLAISQRRWGDCDGQLEVRTHYQTGWSQPTAVWLTSRSTIDREDSGWFKIPNLSLLILHKYNFLTATFEQRLLQTDHGRGEEIARLMTVKDQTVTGIWGRQGRTSRPAPATRPWALEDGPYPYDFADRLNSLDFDSQDPEVLVAPATFEEGVVDWRRIVEAIRDQAESGPVNLARLAFDSDLAA